MSQTQLLNQLRKDSSDAKTPDLKKLNSILSSETDERRKYDSFVLGASDYFWGKLLPNGKKFDASSSLALYELSLSIDQRIITQTVEQSYLRANFKNFAGERIFDEYTGINPTDTVYLPLQLEESGFETTSTNRSGRIKSATNPNEIKFIQAAVSPIRRDIKIYKAGFKLTLEDIELAAAMRLPLQDELMKRVARDLMMQEQYFAFNYQTSGTNNAPEAQGLFFNTSIPTSITWTAGALLAAGTTGRAIIDEFVRIRGVILGLTKNVYEALNQPLCVITSVANVNALTRTYSDLEGKDALSYLTERGFRIGAMPIIGDNQSFFYYKDTMNIEISTSRLVEAQPQSYDADTTSWKFPFRNVTAGLTVKKPSAIYFVAGMNP